MYAATRTLAGTTFSRIEGHLDTVFGDEANPLRHLGALAFLFLWVLAASGIYLYIVMETSVAGAYRSIATLSGGSAGGIVRSLHRYATDAFLLTTVLHLVREWSLDRYSGFRWYSWVSGVPMLWLIFASAIGGYWLPWDQLAQYSAVASAELLDSLGIFTQPVARNFQAPGTVNDRLFSLLVFMHIGLPLFTILAAWAHVHRISRVDHIPVPRTVLSCALALLCLAVLKPAGSAAAADLSQAVGNVPLDWIVLFVHPLTEHVGAGNVWFLLFALSIGLLLLPWLERRTWAPAAVVDAPNCNGCRRCYDDCPYGAVMMLPHPDKARREIAVVDPAYCAGCGICVGACPSSTPFRRQEILVTGIDLPHSPINEWRSRMESWLGAEQVRTDRPRLVVFACDHAVRFNSLGGRFSDANTLALSLSCIGMLPPAFIDYALRSGADGVVVTGCRPGSCRYRLGSVWTQDRLAGVRAPALRSDLAHERLRVVWADAHESEAVHVAIAQFRAHLTQQPSSDSIPVFRRRSVLDVRP